MDTGDAVVERSHDQQLADAVFDPGINTRGCGFIMEAAAIRCRVTKLLE